MCATLARPAMNSEVRLLGRRWPRIGMSSGRPFRPAAPRRGSGHTLCFRRMHARSLSTHRAGSAMHAHPRLQRPQTPEPGHRLRFRCTGIRVLSTLPQSIILWSMLLRRVLSRTITPRSMLPPARSRHRRTQTLRAGGFHPPVSRPQSDAAPRRRGALQVVAEHRKSKSQLESVL